MHRCCLEHEEDFSPKDFHEVAPVRIILQKDAKRMIFCVYVFF